MRIVTWNCCRGSVGEKLSAAERLRPDLLVLQEAQRPASEQANRLWFGDNPRLGVLVAGYGGTEVTPGPAGPGQSGHAVIVNGPLPFHLLAVWTKPEPSYVDGLLGAVRHHQDFLSDAPAVVAGDFNSNSIWDRPNGSVDHSRMVQRLEGDFGLVSAYHASTGCAQGSERHPTHYFRWQEGSPYHIDYCFVPRAWRIEQVQVGGFEEWRSLSDHRPLIVDVGVADA